MIQSAACDSPSNLRVASINCPELIVEWKGQQNRAYTILAKGVDTLTGVSYETPASHYECDAGGHCRATLPVKQGSQVTWSVQGSCADGNMTITGYKCVAPPVHIPFCDHIQAAAATSPNWRVYPNPTTGTLVAEPTAPQTGRLNFTVLDISGRTVMNIAAASLPANNSGYRLELGHLTPGAYLLTIDNGKNREQVKFILTKN